MGQKASIYTERPELDLIKTCHPASESTTICYKKMGHIMARETRLWLWQNGTANWGIRIETKVHWDYRFGHKDRNKASKLAIVS